MTETAQANEAGEATENTEATQNDGAGSESPTDDGYKYAGKFESVDDLEKGYKELTGKLREKTPQAPDEYTFDFTENESLADYKTQLEDLNLTENPMLKAALPAFKKHNISQEAASEIIADVLKADFEATPDAEAELAKLGDQADALLSKVKTFNEKLPEAERSFIESITGTADGVRFAAKLIDMMGEKSIPDGEGLHDSGPDYSELVAEANKLKSLPNFGMNKQAQQRYEKIMDDAMRLKIKQAT